MAGQEAMSSGTGPGRILLDKMRDKTPYSEDRTKPPPKPPKPHDETMQPKMETGTERKKRNGPQKDAHHFKAHRKLASPSIVRVPVRNFIMSIDPGDVVHEDTVQGGQQPSNPSFEKDFGRSQEAEDMDFGGGAPLNQARIQELYATIDTLTRERQMAEEKAERASERVVDMKKLLDADKGDISEDTRSLSDEIERLQDEKRFLQEQLSDAQSHIFSLQPYRKDMTPEEVGREFDDLVESVQDWVQKLLGPALEDVTKGAEEIMSHARQRPSDAMRFKKTLLQYPDLVHASTLPETDEDILVGVILRYLHDNIFQKILYGSIQHYTEVISLVENLLQTTVEPKRDLFSVRTWTAEAYNALLGAPQFKSVRERRREDLTSELGSTLKVFCSKDKTQWLFEGIEEKCIEPAMKLYEKFQVSTHHFYLDANPFIFWGPKNQIIASPEFISMLDKLDCRNILQNRKTFSLAKLEPQPTTEELHQYLLNICTVVPALCMRQIGQRNSIKEPITVRRQQMLVAWGPEARRKKFADSGDETIISQVYFGAKGESSERSWTSSFPWG